MLLWRMPGKLASQPGSRGIMVPVDKHRRISGTRRTTSTDSAGKSASRKAAMPPRAQIFVVFRRRR